MHRSFIAAIIAATIVITGFSAAPARAGGDDIAKALAGLAMLAIIGKAISDNRDGHQVSRQAAPRHQYVQPRPLPKRIARNALPGQCLRVIDTRRGTTRMFMRRCLERNYRYVNRLPQACAQRVRTDRGPRYGYNARCLRQSGFRIARH
jgi:hypothetical protein